MPFQILTRENGTSIAYNKLEGNSPGLIFMSGFMSDMNGSKALALEQHCQERGLAFLRFDYMGHGNSSGNFADGTIGLWAENALTAFDELTEGPQIIIGSSMGGWMMILTAVSRPERVAGLVGIAAAPDFTEDLLPKQLTKIQLSKIQEDGFVVIPSEYETPYTITKTLLDDGTQHLVLRNEIPLDCPIRLLHGLEDTSVPWETALKIQNMVRSNDVEVTLIKNGDHRLSREEDLEKLKKTVMEIV
jgi:pimeloyl-ACP methyl ester carboxylesterase